MHRVHLLVHEAIEARWNLEEHGEQIRSCLLLMHEQVLGNSRSLPSSAGASPEEEEGDRDIERARRRVSSDGNIVSLLLEEAVDGGSGL